MTVMKARHHAQQANALRRHDRQPVVCVAAKSQTQPSLILDGLVPVFSTCRTCGLIMQVTRAGDHTHPTCDPQPTQIEQWQESWLAIASSAPYEKLKPELRNKLERLEFKIDVVRDEPIALHNAAMQYASFSWKVFRLARHDKRPAIPKKHGGNGVLDATNDVDRICRWWSRNPDHNIGLATGHLFDVIDVDPDKGGAESISKLLAANRVPIVHAVVATANGGMHLYIKPTGRGNFAGVLPGVDYRGVGGYVCGPPSTLGSRVRSWSWSVEPSPNIKGGK